MTTPPRITITADDVRELLRRFDGWEITPHPWDGWEGWGYNNTGAGAAIPTCALKADYQTRLWDAVRDAGLAMGIGTDIFVHLGTMLQERK